MTQAISLVSVLTRANQYIDSADYKAANVLFSLVQEHFPEQPDCLHGMGVLALRTGHAGPAFELLKRALKALSLLPYSEELRPTKAMFLAHLGRAAQFEQDFAFATVCWHESLELEENSAVREWLNETKNIIQQVVQKTNHYIEEKSQPPVKAVNKTAKHLKALLAKKQKKANQASQKTTTLELNEVPDELLAQQIQAWIGKNDPIAARHAEIACQELLKRYPDLPDGLHWMGIACHYQKRSQEGLVWLRKAIATAPEHPYFHNTLGVVLRKAGTAEECIQSFKNALRFKPDYAEAGMNLANILRDENELDEAIAWYKWAQSLKANYFESWNNLGILYKNKKEYEKAREAFEKALELKPDYANPYLNLAVIHEEKKERADAVKLYRKTLELKPDTHEVWLSLMHNQMHHCDWNGLEEGINRVRTLVQESYPGELLPFNFLSLPGTTPLEQRKCGELFTNSRYMTFMLQGKKMHFEFKQEPKQKLKIGFLSADFNEHAVSISLVQVIEYFDHNQYELYGYAYGKNDNGPTRQRISRAFDHFIDIDRLGHIDAAKRIYEDQIDILVDLTAYTAGGRAEIMALHPAPIQANYLGYPSTMAAPFIEYLIGDPIITPPEHQAFYSETLALLPHCYFPNDRKRVVEENSSRETEGLPLDKFVFCSFNQPYKINAALWSDWCTILKRVPNSVLWLHAFEMPARDNLRVAAKEHGIDPERILFATVKQRLSEHLGRLRLADLALDTSPYNGHTTTSDALWAGLPVIAQLGDSFAARVAASILNAANVPELITHSRAEYVELACTLASSAEQLNTLRTKINTSRETCPLYDSPRLAKNLGRMFSAMYENWLAGNAPRIIQLEDQDA